MAIVSLSLDIPTALADGGAGDGGAGDRPSGLSELALVSAALGALI